MLLAQRAFLADSSHELRRPLTVLRTNIDVMNDPALSERDRHTIEVEMRAEAESMSRLVTGLALLSREGELAFQLAATSLPELCSDALDEARSTHPQRTFLADIADGICVNADAERLAQAVANLLQNAAMYSRPGGAVQLTLRLDNGLARIDVIDEGPGLSPADIEHAFDRFYRGSSARSSEPGGFGLGLAIVKHVVEAHGGSVSLSSAPGSGTLASILLPGWLAPEAGSDAEDGAGYALTAQGT
jgi:signal transduction histidine kinase